VLRLLPGTALGLLIGHCVYPAHVVSAGDIAGDIAPPHPRVWTLRGPLRPPSDRRYRRRQATSDIARRHQATSTQREDGDEYHCSG
jgi:hypothetical protein